MNYDLKDLKLFMEIGRLGNFNQASQKCFLSPSAATMRIKKLEEDFGTRLFIRNTRKVELTAAGLIFMEYAEHMLLMAQQLDTSMLTFKDTNEHLVRIGVNYCGLTGRLSKDLGKFLSKNSDYTIDTKMHHSALIPSLILQRKIDFGVCNYFGEETPGIEFIPYSSDSFVFIEKKTKDSSDAKFLNPLELNNRALVMLSSENLAGAFAEKKIREMKIQPRVIARFPTTRSALQVLEQVDCGMVTLKSSVPKKLTKFSVREILSPWSNLDIRICLREESIETDKQALPLINFLKGCVHKEIEERS